MNWYRVILELKSPLHIGYAPLGFVERTRYYLPARSIWGALTAAKARKDDAVPFPDYIGVGNRIAKDFKFTHFFVCTKKTDTTYDYFLPNYFGEEMHFGTLSKTRFEQRFISSFGQTALAPDSLTADDKSLHEKEAISYLTIPRDKEGRPEQVFLCGYVWVADDKNACWLDVLEGCQVGADRRNGLGLIGKVQKLLVAGSGWDISGISFVEDTIYIEPNKPFPCHVKVKGSSSVIWGDIELLRWRSWDTKYGAGRANSGKPQQCWVPGSFGEPDTEKKNNRRFVLTPDTDIQGVFSISIQTETAGDDHVI